MIPCIEYTRASTSRQEFSVGDQDRNIRDWAARNNYKIVKSYCDDGISGHYAAKRPGFLSMIEDITAERLDVKALLIWDSFRFARNMVEFLTYKQMIQQHGISVIAVSEPMIPDNDAQLYIDAINGASGELYLRKLSKDSKRGIRAKVVDRHEHLGYAPFGYRLDRNIRALVIDEEAARWVHYAFDAIEAGSPYLEIRRAFDDACVRTVRGGRWTRTGIKYLLTNRTYCGDLEVTLDSQHGIYDGKHPAIIDRDQFERVQAIIADRTARMQKHARAGHDRKHWLSGLMRCPICGHSMSYNRTRGYLYYFCAATSYPHSSRRSIKVSIAEQIVIDALRDLYTSVTPINTVKIRLVRPSSAIDYDAEIDRLKSQLRRARKAYIEEIDTLEEYRENKARLTSEISKFEGKKNTTLSHGVDADDFRTRCHDVLHILTSDAPMDEKVAVSHDLIDRIVPDLIEKKLDIYFLG